MFQLDFVHKECDSSGVQLTLYRAYAATELEIPFNTRESGDFTVHNIAFKGLADINRLPGKQLFEMIQE